MPRTAGLTIEVDWSAEKVKKGLADLNAMFKGGLSGLSVDSSGMLKGLTSVQNLYKDLINDSKVLTQFNNQATQERINNLKKVAAEEDVNFKKAVNDSKLLTQYDDEYTKQIVNNQKRVAALANANAQQAISDAKLLAEIAKQFAVEGVGDAHVKRAEAQARESNAKAAQAETRAIRENVNLKIAEQRLSKIGTKPQEDAYGRLSRIYNEVARRAQNLATIHGIESKAATGAANSAKKLGDRLKEIDATVGRHQRNVGNYAGPLQGVSQSLNQITREFPAFANSMQTGFMAISNNIPMLVDQLTAISARNKELTAQGQPTVSAFKTIAGAIFSWQTALSLGVTALTVYGPKLWDYITGNKEASEATKKLKEEQEDFNKSIQDSEKTAATQIGTLRRLAQTAGDASQSTQSRRAAIKQLQDMYPSYFKNLTLETAQTAVLSNQVNILTKNLMAASRARVLSGQADKEVERSIRYEKTRVTAAQQLTSERQKLLALEQRYNYARTDSGFDVTKLRPADYQVYQEQNKVVKNARYGFSAMDMAMQGANASARALNNAVVGLQDDMGSLDLTGADISKTLNKGAASGKTLSDAIKEVNRDLSGLETRKESNLIGEFDYLEEKSRVLAAGIKKLTEDFDVKPGNSVLAAWAEQARVTNGELRRVEMKLKDIRFSTEDFSIYDRIAQNRDKMPTLDPEWQKLNKSITPDWGDIFKGSKMPTEVETYYKNLASWIAKGNDATKKELDRLRDIVSDGITGALGGLGESIAGAFSKMENPFGSLLGFLGQSIKEFGKYLIQLGGIREIMDKAIKALGVSGAPAIIAGVAAVGIGTYLQSLANKRGKQSFRAFADGGVLYGPTMSLMGEYPGVANNPEVVAPLNKLKDLMGNTGAQVFIPETRIDGRDLVVIYKRAEQFNNR